nr:MAG TPA: hypothetical protein [Caudoviricetes sp.]
MNRRTNNDIGCILIFLLVISLGSDFYHAHKAQQADQKRSEQLNKLQLQYAPAERDTIRDSVKTVTQKVIMMPPEEYKEFAADRQLLKDLNIKVSQIMADQRTSVVTEGTVKTLRENSIYKYSDKWLSVKLNTADSMLTYRARDSLQCLVTRNYKHRFLWWKWGTDGYNIKMINFNPNSTILYNNYIQVNR